jgi:hypothetical protein
MAHQVVVMEVVHQDYQPIDNQQVVVVQEVIQAQAVKVAVCLVMVVVVQVAVVVAVVVVILHHHLRVMERVSQAEVQEFMVKDQVGQVAYM